MDIYKHGSLLSFGGLKVVSSDNMHKAVAVEIEKSPWLRFVERILKWNPCNAELLTPDTELGFVPDPELYILGDKVVGHPETIKAMIQGLSGYQSRSEGRGGMLADSEVTRVTDFLGQFDA